MSRFKIGDYVTSIYPDSRGISRVGYYSGEHRVVMEVGVMITRKIKESELRLATNNDYLNTLTPEQKARFFFNIALGQTVINWREYPNQVHIDWLNSAYDGWVVE